MEANGNTFQTDLVVSLLNEGKYDEAAKLVVLNVSSNGEQLLHLLASNIPKPGHENAYLQTVRYLCKIMDINGPDYTGATALFRAAKVKNTLMVNLLIELQADPIQRLVASGQRAVDVYPEHEGLVQYTTLFEDKIINNPYANYKYSLAEYYRRSYYARQHPNKNFYDGHPIDAEKGREELVQADLAYIHYLRHEVSEDVRKRCILCNEHTEFYCPNCSIVRLCRKHWVDSKPSTRLLSNLHMIACDHGLFEHWAAQHPEGNN